MINKYIIVLLIISITGGCKKLIEIDPPIDKITPEIVFNSDAGAASVITGIYSDLTFDGQIATGNGSLGFLVGLAADEVSLKNTDSDPQRNEVYQNRLLATSGVPFSIWQKLYSLIFRVNSAIDGINKSTLITSAAKKQLLGEACLIRSLMYFYLVNLYGDVPLVLNAKVTENSTAPRAPKEEIYLRIVEDLKYAKENLNVNYLNADVSTISSQRVRPNSAVASALLARIYLYTSKWEEAEAEATSVIINPDYLLEPINNVFQKNSREAIWQLQRTSLLQKIDGEIYVPVTGGIERTFYLSDQVFNNFENNDQRKAQWTLTVSDLTGTFTYPYKYRDQNLPGPESITEFTIILRLAEQYLIRAEARANQGKLVGENSAESDLNIIRNRAGLAGTTATNQPELLDAILNERRSEYFTEWGHRWLDLKRTQQVDQVMTIVTPHKGGVWEPYKALFPIPLTEIQRNPSLSGHQNAGY